MSENVGLHRQEIIPSIVSFSHERDSYVVGVEARDLGIKGRTNAHNFKMVVGLPPAEFSNDKRYWMDHGKPGTNLPRTYSCREITTIFLEQVLKLISVDMND
jgi:hypothetical protein